MKVILAGSTGFIGEEILSRCLANASITSIVALSRRPLPDPYSNVAKVKTIIIKDFLSYTPDILAELQGADACIWALGQRPPCPEDLARQLNITFPKAAAEAFAKQLGDAKKFRLIYASGMSAERDPTKSLWVMAEFRRIRGEGENELLKIAKDNPKSFEVQILRPGGVLPKNPGIKAALGILLPFVAVDVLAALCVELAVKGIDREQTLENADIKRKGMAVL